MLKSGQHDGVQCPVELPVATAFEAVTDDLAAAGGDRGDARERGARGFSAQATLRVTS